LFPFPIANGALAARHAFDSIVSTAAVSGYMGLNVTGYVFTE